VVDARLLTLKAPLKAVSILAQVVKQPRQMRLRRCETAGMLGGTTSHTCKMVGQEVHLAALVRAVRKE
jgi:hypothetical protein